MRPFTQGYDLIGDKSLVAVSLPGHSEGMIGLLVKDAGGRPVFMVADACWSLDACKEERLPAALARLATHNTADYKKTFMGLSQLANREPSISILPSHCASSWEKFNND